MLASRDRRSISSSSPSPDDNNNNDDDDDDDNNDDNEVYTKTYLILYALGTKRRHSLDPIKWQM